MSLNRGLYIEGNDWCEFHNQTELFDYFNCVYRGTGEDNEISEIQTPEECRFGTLDFGYYSNQQMAMAGSRPDRLQAGDGAESIFNCNQDYGRSVFFDGHNAYRTYSQSLCFLGIQNQNDHDRAQFLRQIIEALAGYQGVLTVELVEVNTSLPIPNATVIIDQCNLTALTDENGAATINRFPIESFTLSVEAEGYESRSGVEYSFEGDSELQIRIPLTPTQGLKTSPPAPQAFKIHKIYPNPFNSELSVVVEMGLSRELAIEVLDLNGRRVEQLNHLILNPGLHSFSFNSNQWQSGVYNLALRSGKYLVLNKVVLIR